MMMDQSVVSAIGAVCLGLTGLKLIALQIKYDSISGQLQRLVGELNERDNSLCQGITQLAGEIGALKGNPGSDNTESQNRRAEDMASAILDGLTE
jgi:hypothetical protein